MKKFYLLKLYPSYVAGSCSAHSGNEVINEYNAENQTEAIKFFNKVYALSLDSNGYVKYGDITYTIAIPYGQNS